MVGVALAGLFAVQACFENRNKAEPGSAAAPTHLQSPEALATFFNALDALEGRQASDIVRVLQIGDSHTANDSFSGRLRERLQTRFGEAGRGWLPAGIPFKYYHPNLVTVSETGWEHYRPENKEAGAAFGLDGMGARSKPPEAGMAIDSDETQGFDYFAVEFLTRPDGAAFAIQIDGGEPIRVSTASAQTEIKRFELPLPHPARRAELRVAGRPPVDLLGWAVERRVPGVIYENHGSIGATVGLIGQLTQAAVAFELASRRPALLIVAFGTNEGFDDSLDPSRYAGRFRDLVAGLRQQASGIPVLVLGPPDGNRIGANCTAAACPAAADASGNNCAWHAPPRLGSVRDEQQRVAALQGWAYWDWFGAMGGACSIDRMAGADPRLAMPDHVHLSKAGYTLVADMLFTDLMAAYDKWRARGRVS
jgi:lysophospholipase L1-like esterase